jgi:hypothetical protein
LVVDGQGLGVGLDGQPAADVTGWHTVAVAIELEAQIFADQSIGGVAVIGKQGRHRKKRLNEESLAGTFSRFAVDPLVGDFLQPLPHLAIHVSQVGEGAQRPEVLAQVSDAGALDFAFFPG